MLSNDVLGSGLVTCSVIGCNGPVHGRGMCNKHRQRAARNGDPLLLKRRQKGSGTLASGYILRQEHGIKKMDHVGVAERALGRELCGSELVHHANEVRADNRNENLVICPDNAYHYLLHRRMRARDACGNPNWRKCECCHQYDDPASMWVMSEGRARHRACFNEYQKTYAATRKIGDVARA